MNYMNIINYEQEVICPYLKSYVHSGTAQQEADATSTVCEYGSLKPLNKQVIYSEM